MDGRGLKMSEEQDIFFCDVKGCGKVATVVTRFMGKTETKCDEHWRQSRAGYLERAAPNDD